MTDTTNHAMTPERIAKLRNQIGLGPDDACDLLDALDALTRGLGDAKEDARLWHESEKACSAQFDKLLDENRAQSARIATLEEALGDVLSPFVTGGPCQASLMISPGQRCMCHRCVDDRARAALAPKGQQK